MDLWQWTVINYTRDELETFAMVSWSIWLSRNQFIFEGKASSAKGIVSQTGNLGGQYLLSEKMKLQIGFSSSQTHSHIWDNQD